MFVFLLHAFTKRNCFFNKVLKAQKLKNIKSTSETGHAKNLANFEDLITFTASYGSSYNPTKTTLKQAALTTLFTQAKADLATVASKNVRFNRATHARTLVFEPLQKLSTRLFNAFASTDATPEMVNDTKTINRKIQLNHLHTM